MEAIQTEYNGYKFRSRLEARWAVFFNAAGIEYQYEPEGFKLDNGLMYLPDFYLPDVNFPDYTTRGSNGLYVEVKGIMRNQDLNKVEEFSKRKAVLVVGQIPKSNHDFPEMFKQRLWECFWSFDYICPCICGFARFRKNESGNVFIDTSDYEDACGDKEINQALIKARQARFEHGETPVF